MLDLIWRFKCQKIALCIGLTVTTCLSYAFEEIPLKRLDNLTYSSLKALHNSAMTMNFFAPECSWCKKQHRVLKEISADCHSINPVMVGINGNERDYKRALRRMSNNFPAIIAPKPLQAALENNHVPRIIVVDANWQVIANLVGYVDKATLITAFKQWDLC
jgi:thioredoxin-related protein